MITLILACSGDKKWHLGRGKTKRPNPAAPRSIPAIEAYTGRMSFLPGKSIAGQHGFNVLILSKKYGLITPETPIEHYDERFTDKDPFNGWDALDPSLHGFHVSSEPYFCNLPAYTDRFERLLPRGFRNGKIESEMNKLRDNPALMVAKIEAHRAKFGD